ncbi:excinuclease ABC subunit UvrA, partial [Candidatus Parcubacteria bacterium]
MNDNKIIIRGAKIHNLKNIDLDIPKNKLVVFTGLSGSGKSSLAFDTIYAEGQRRYMESLSGYARQFLEMQDKPDVDEISGLSPTIAINQKTSSHNPRSTVGTISEIYDYLRVLYARVAKPYHPETGKVILPLTFSDLEGKIIDAVKKSDVLLFAPMVEDKKGDFNGVLQAAKNAEFSQVRYDGVILDVDEAIALKKQKNKKHSIEILVEKIEQDKNISQEKIKTVLNRALDLGNGELILYKDRNGEDEKIVLGYELPNGFRIADIEPRFFSFNSPQGACSSCTGLGVKLVFEPEFVIPNKKLTIEQGAVKPWNRIAGNQKGYMEVLRTVAKKKKIDLNKPIEKLSAKQYK